MSSEFVAAMEDVLDLYAEPYDPQRPVICFDETSTQLLAHIREPLPAKPGRHRRQDYEYQRAGTRNLFLSCDPRRGWRHVAVTERRTMQDFAHQMRWLVDEAYPDIPVVRVVLDNLNTHLNTHRMASLYETFQRQRPGASSRGWSSTTHPSVAAGSTWRRLSSACWPEPASGDGTPMKMPCKGASAPMRRSATRREPTSTGGSLPRTPEPNSAVSILTLQI